jgi:GTPase KRas protein
MSKQEYTVIVIGGGGVGKTCITVQLTEGRYEENYNPTIEETYTKEISIDNQTIKLNIIDTAGQEEYAVLRDNYWRTGDGFLLVYDLTNRGSFDALPGFYDAIVKAKEIQPLPIVLCSNKCDLPKGDWKTRDDEILKITKENSWGHFYTSAKTCANVREAFDELVRRIIKFHKAMQEGGDGTAEETDSNDKKKKGGFLKGLFGRKK